MTLEDAIETVLEMATESVVDDSVLINDPHLESLQRQQLESIRTVEDFFVNNVFN